MYANAILAQFDVKKFFAGIERYIYKRKPSKFILLNTTRIISATVANPCVAIAFSYKELIDTKTSMLVGTGCCVVLYVVTMVVYYPLLCLVL